MKTSQIKANIEQKEGEVLFCMFKRTFKSSSRECKFGRNICHVVMKNLEKLFMNIGEEPQALCVVT